MLDDTSTSANLVPNNTSTSIPSALLASCSHMDTCHRGAPRLAFDEHHIGVSRLELEETSAITILVLDDTSTSTISTLLASCPHFDDHHLKNLVS